MKTTTSLLISFLISIFSCTQQTEVIQQPKVNMPPTSTTPSYPVVKKATGIPLFIGYTEKALSGAVNLNNVPTKISSFSQFQLLFGKEKKENSATPLGHYYLYKSMEQFFNQGGSTCYILSVGNYNNTITKSDLIKPLTKNIDIDKKLHPDLIVIPDAVALTKDACTEVYRKVLEYCGRKRNCFGIFDIPRGYNKETMDKDIQDFRTMIGNQNLKYGAVYYPWVKTSDRNGEIKNIPASGNIAGVYARVDNSRGVWKAPANIELYSVIGLTVNISNEIQEGLNAPTDGKSVNAIRFFSGIGTKVWGARTLDGNSLDWRYINVVRTTIMMEASINQNLEKYVFEPNDSNTWIKVKESVEEFLTNIWREGALAGSKPEDAFSVRVGLGTTMTQQDIDDGRMIVMVAFAPLRPAEFIVLKFSHKMVNE